MRVGNLQIVDSDKPDVRRWHGVKGAELHWKLTDEGLLVTGSKEVRRTKGEPTTVNRIVAHYGAIVREFSDLLNVPEHMIIATIAIESMGNPEAERREPQISDRSIGLMQLLTGTAYQVSRMSDVVATIDLRPEPMGGKVEPWRTVLQDPATNIGLGVLALRWLNEEYELRWDPILCYASYNSGSPRPPKKKNAWGMAAAPEALMSFARWYGDTCAVLGYCV